MQGERMNDLDEVGFADFPESNRLDQTARILSEASEQLESIGERGLAAMLDERAREYTIAAVRYLHARSAGLRPIVVAAGGIERGQFVMVGTGTAKVRRQSDTGIELLVDGFWSWENISGRSAPMVVCDEH